MDTPDRKPSRGVQDLHASVKQPRIELRGFDLRANSEVRLDPYTMMEVQVLVHGQIRDRETGAQGEIAGRELIPGHHWLRMDAKERSRFVFNAARRALEHELAECFYVDGVRVYDPHKDEGGAK